MVKAFIMIKLGNTEYMGLTKTVVEEVSKIPGIIEVYAIFGRYDLIAELEIKDLSELSRLTEDKLRAIPGVLSTETFICHESS